MDSTFRIRPPATLAVLDGVQEQVRNELVTIPLASVVEALEASAQRLGRLAPYVDLRGQLLPVVQPSTLLDLQGADAAPGMILVVQTEQLSFGSAVDRVLGLERSVAKPLEQRYRLVEEMDETFRTPTAVSGATVLESGKVGIVDVTGLQGIAFRS